MLRKTFLAISIVTIIASGVVACNKGDDNKPEVTTVLIKPNGECMGYDKCPPIDEKHLTATVNPQTGTSNVTTVVPTVTTSP